MTGRPLEIYAIKYGEYVGTRGRYFYGSAGDPHETPVPIDYFVWLIRGPEGDIVVDLGFRHASGTSRGARTYAGRLRGSNCSVSTARPCHS